MKRILKSILMLTLVLALCIPTFAESQTETIFTDISSDHYAFEAIKTMKAYGIISGYPDGTFRPQNTVSRVEFAVMMVKALKLDVDHRDKSSFTDMNGNEWAVPYVEAAKEYLTGYKSSSGYTFKPSSPSVREDMAVALIRALGKDTSSDSILSQYADQSDISSNLRYYVASAIQNNLMTGETTNNLKYFRPQRSLTRAEAASLLMNVIREEKIIFDDEEKVVLDGDEEGDFDDKSKDKSNNGKGHKDDVDLESVKNQNGTLVLKWDKINDSKFTGYKVVASKSDSTPSYPKNGYAYWITDKNKTSAVIKAGDSYNGSEFSTFEAGSTYYFSITAVYDDETISGNVIKATVPYNSITDSSLQDNNLKLVAENQGEFVKLTWTISQEEKFQGYKVVASQGDSTPVYPDNGYFTYITGRNINTVSIGNGSSYNGGDITKFEKGKTYYFSITYLYESGKKTSNTVQIKF